MTDITRNTGEKLQSDFGGIDIYLFDQLLRGRFDGYRRVLDAGCGSGRNLVYFMNSGYEVFAVDHDPAAVEKVRSLAADLARNLPPENIRIGEIDDLPWPNLHMDAVICSAVLHFATDLSHFGRMLRELWRVLRPGGLLFVRLASVIGLEEDIDIDDNRRALLPDGTERFLVDQQLLDKWVEQLDALQLDPLKTTNVNNQRCMTTWILQKPA